MSSRQLAGVDRRLLVGGAGLAGIVLGWVLLMTLFGAGGEEGDVALPIATGAAPAASTTTVPAEEPYVPASRDPFKPNVATPRPSSAATPAASTSPVQVASTLTPTVTTVAPTTASAGAAAGTAALELKSIATDGSGTLRATITVDGQTFSPAKGERFSHGYRLESITGNCVEVSAQATKAQMCLPAAKR